MQVKVMLVGFLCFLYIFLAILLGLFLQVTFGYIFLLPFSKRKYLQLAAWFQEKYLAMFVFLLERHKNLKLEFTGDPYKQKESCLLIANHQNQDWAPLYSLAWRQGMIGYVRTMLKDVNKWIPGFGWGMYLNYWPFLKRSWDQDSTYLANLFRIYKDNDLPLVLWLFPEGTRMTPSKLKASQDYCKEKGYAVFDKVLLPRHKGFISALQGLDGVVDYVYDITLAYTGWTRFPAVSDFLFLDPNIEYTMHVHVRKVPMSELKGKNEEELKRFLMEAFGEKDRLLKELEKTGHFPGQRRYTKLNKSERNFPFAFYTTLVVAFLVGIYRYCF